jgi:5'-nucleotidase
MKRLLPVLTLIGILGLLVPLGAQQLRTVPPYRILVTNDDGVHSPGLAAIAQILQAIGNVTIVAPSQNQSGAGHSITTSEPVFREDLTLPNGMRAIGLTAPPASVVNIAMRNILTPRPDLVVSGINRGYNLGFSAYLSGTVGAAREAAMHGVPGIAASLAVAATPREYIYAAEEVFGVARRLKQFGLPAYTFINVSVPPMPDGGYKGYMVTTQAMMRGGEESFAETKDPRSGRAIYFNVYKEGMSGAPQGTDIWAVQNGFVSVTPMSVGETSAKLVDSLKAWFK